MPLKRHIEHIAFSPEFGRQMRFIAGPRQSGKTTMARNFLAKAGCKTLYYNWDNRKTREAYIRDNHFFLSDIYNVPAGKDGKRWICLDEIHKYPDWKNILKDFFDTFQEEINFIVTGSARLDMMRKSGDSLTGRYFNFRLNPVTLRELCGSHMELPPQNPEELIRRKLDTPIYHQKEFLDMLNFSGFPEPLLKASNRFHRRWQSAYVDTMIREDLRELTQIKNLEKTAALLTLLPERISSPLSINAIARDIGSSFATTANYLAALELGYLIFRIDPYYRKIARSIKKEKKAYFYDWTRNNNKGARFENYVAMELKTLIEMWEDSGEGNFKLFFIRDRDGKETDFLVTREDEPWLLAEAKVSRSEIAYHHKKHRTVLGNIPFIQIVLEENVAEKLQPGIFQMSASRLFA